eukprot:10236666-Lingulodinium_polyedra.AAC.1
MPALQHLASPVEALTSWLDHVSLAGSSWHSVVRRAVSLHMARTPVVPSQTASITADCTSV